MGDKHPNKATVQPEENGSTKVEPPGEGLHGWQGGPGAAQSDDNPAHADADENDDA